MIRKLAFALSFLGAGFSSLIYALGLGEATVQSALNQPLKAEIELVNVGDLEVSEILPGLATREEFLKAGVDRVYFLSDIRFKVEQGENGAPIVILTTNKPVREPYLNFLVEVIWPSGRLLREYALLIDPPVFAEEEPAVVAAPAPTTTAAPQPVAQRPAGDRVTIPARAVTATPATIQGTYGPTNSRDTLWEIAMKARPDRSVSPQQVMLAIQDLNPEAFIDNNINKLKAGQVLRLPSKADMQRRSTAEAINEVIAQNEALQPRKRKAIVSADKAPATQAAQKQSEPSLSSGDELKLVVAEAETESVAASAGQGGGVSGPGGDAEPEKELTLTLEKLDKATIENRELNSRVDDLEEQLETLQRLLTLKNDQLASIQEQMRDNEMARLQQEAQGEQAMTGSTGLSESDTVDAGQAEGAPKVVPEEASDKASVDATEKEETAVAEEKVKAEVQQEPAQVTSAQPQNFIEMILANPLYMGLAGLGVIVLLILLWLVSRHNAQQERALHEQLAQEDEDDSVESVFDTEDNEALAQEELQEEEALYPDEQMDEASLADAEEDAGSSSAEQEDVIAEADVYIAYGRLDQAATILEEAISREPVRTDYRLKLLEVYKEAGNTDAFDRQFSELEAIQDAQALEEAQRIRAESVDRDLEEIDHKELELSDDLTAEDAQESIESEEAAIVSEEQALLSEDPVLESEPDNSFDLDAVEEDAELGDVELDVDLSSEELDLDVDVDIDLEQSDLSAGAELDELEAEVDDAELDAAIDQIDQELSEDLDLELDDIDLSDELDKEAEIELPDDLSIPDELTSVDEPLEDDAEVVEAVEQAETEVPEAPDTVVSDDILEEAVEALGDPESFEPELGEGDDFDFLEGTDEASTKLDLARAYIDMGDVDGAKDILQEVEAEGSPEQQAEAKELLDSLGS